MIGILCGLSSEAKIAETISGAKIACSAAVPAKARTLAKDLIQQGATRLLSFGVAGALDIGLPVGSLIVGSKVVSASGSWECDIRWADQLLKALPQARCCPVWGSETLVAKADEKIELHRTTGCSIVDMESQCLAEVAASAKLPIAVVRVVCDEAKHNVPLLVMSAINPDGSINVKAAILGILRQPSQIIDLIKVGHSMKLALKVLAEASKNIA